MGKGRWERTFRFVSPGLSRKFRILRFHRSLSPITLFPCSPIFVLFSLLTLLSFACGHPPPGRGAGEVEATSQNSSSGQIGQVKFRVETVVSNLEVPWSIVWAPDGRMFFTERSGRLLEIAGSPPRKWGGGRGGIDAPG